MGSSKLGLMVFSKNPLDGKFIEFIAQGQDFIRYAGQVHTLADFDAEYNHHKINIVFLEIGFNETGSDLYLLKQIHFEYPGMIIIAYSLQDQNSVIHTALKNGAYSYLVKPLIPKDIVSLLKRIYKQESIVDYLSSRSIPTEKLNHYAKAIQISSKEELPSVALEIHEEIADSCNGNLNKAIITSRKYLEYIYNLLKAEFSNADKDPLRIICQKYLEQLKATPSFEALLELFQDFITDCSNLFNNSQQGLIVRRINYAKELIQTYLEQGKEITLDGIAGEMYISRYYLSHTFKKVEGINFENYLQDCRLNLAKFLLVTTEDSIEIIATKCGYKEVNSFRRLFKNKANISPSKYRLSLKHDTAKEKPESSR